MIKVKYKDIAKFGGVTIDAVKYHCRTKTGKGGGIKTLEQLYELLNFYRKKTKKHNYTNKHV